MYGRRMRDLGQEEMAEMLTPRLPSTHIKCSACGADFGEPCVNLGPGKFHEERKADLRRESVEETLKVLRSKDPKFSGDF